MCSEDMECVVKAWYVHAHFSKKLMFHSLGMKPKGKHFLKNC